MNLEEQANRIAALLHAVQSGVAIRIEHGSDQATPKHLRVGVNNALIETSALLDILIEKGALTREEYFDKVIWYLEKEVKRYEKDISDHLGGVKITLA